VTVLVYVYSPCPRPGISDKTPADLRSITGHPGSVRVEEAIDARTPQAAVFAGFFGADLKSSGSPTVWVGAALLRPASSWRRMTPQVASYDAPLEVAA
jgi:hypothetical protein